MITFNQITKFPSFFKDRNNSLENLKISVTKVFKDENNYLTINSSWNNYEQIIIFNNNKITSKSEVKFFCSCDSFKYEFASVVKKFGSLCNEEFFTNTKKAKYKNPFNLPGGCKHIVALSNYIIKNLNKIYRSIK